VRRSRLLLALGLMSAAVYLVAAYRLSWWRLGANFYTWSHLLGANWVGFGGCLVGIAALMAAYIWGWRLAHGLPGLRKIIWSLAGFFAVTLFWLTPITSDLFGYLSHAHLFTDLHLDPLEVAPLDAPGNSFALVYRSPYAANPSIYGPAWLLLSAPGTLGPYDLAWGLAYLKGLAVLAFLGSAWLLERILLQVRPDSAVEGLYVFAWSPLVLLMGVGDGHNDLVMMALVLLAFWLLLRDSPLLAFGALAVSVWVKYVSAIFFPLFVIYVLRHAQQSAQASDYSDRSQARSVGGWLHDPRSVVLTGTLAMVGISVLLFLPFWQPDLLSVILERLVSPINWSGGETALSDEALRLGLVFFAVAYAVLAYRLARGRGSFQQLANTGFAVSLLLFALGAARSQPWHLMWPAALVSLSDRPWALPLLAGLSIVMLAAQVWVEWGTPGSWILF
jgi:hypothetical protein